MKYGLLFNFNFSASKSWQTDSDTIPIKEQFEQSSAVLLLQQLAWHTEQKRNSSQAAQNSICFPPIQLLWHHSKTQMGYHQIFKTRDTTKALPRDFSRFVQVCNQFSLRCLHHPLIHSYTFDQPSESSTLGDPKSGPREPLPCLF